MTRNPFGDAFRIAAVAGASAVLALLLGGCVAAPTASPLETTATTIAPTETAVGDATEAAPSPEPVEPAEPVEPVEVDPARYTDEYGHGTTFGVGSGTVNCQITSDSEFPDEAAWGCAVSLGQTWRWEDTSFAEYCAQLEEIGCRNGLVVRGDDAPTPRRNTDAAFGGMRAAHILAEGERITVGTVSCQPTTDDGVRCEDATSGQGFELSPTAIVVVTYGE